MDSESFLKDLKNSSEEEIGKVLSQLSPENRKRLHDAVAMADALKTESRPATELMNVRIVDLSGKELKQLELAELSWCPR